MKNEKYMFKILKNIVNKENIDNISKYLIYPDNKGYVAYGEYKIKTGAAAVVGISTKVPAVGLSI